MLHCYCRHWLSEKLSSGFLFGSQESFYNIMVVQL
jgi:hypothetical protein